MKKKTSALIGLLVVIFLLVGILGCSAPAEAEKGSTPAGAPTFQPTNHEGRFESNGGRGCYGCHGNGAKANPNLTGATVLPENHYVDGSYQTKQIDPNRLQCITCHPVS